MLLRYGGNVMRYGGGCNGGGCNYGIKLLWTWWNQGVVVINIMVLW